MAFPVPRIITLLLEASATVLSLAAFGGCTLASRCRVPCRVRSVQSAIHAGDKFMRNRLNAWMRKGIELARRIGDRNFRVASNRLGRVADAVWHIPPSGGYGSHSASFPKELVRRALLLTAPPREMLPLATVIDIYGGSGTVSAEAKKLGHRSIFIDANPDLYGGSAGYRADRRARSWCGQQQSGVGDADGTLIMSLTIAHNRLRKFAPVTGEVARIAEKRSIKRTGTQVLRPVQLRNLSGRSGQVPPLNQLLREGRASSRRIDEQEKGIRRFRRIVLIEWLDQAERLWIAAEIHGLKNKHFLVFAAQIGMDRSSAYELLKLHPNRKKVLAQCQRKTLAGLGGLRRLVQGQTPGQITNPRRPPPGTKVCSRQLGSGSRCPTMSMARRRRCSTTMIASTISRATCVRPRNSLSARSSTHWSKMD